MARSIFYDSLKKILFAFVAMMFVAPAFSATLPAGYTQLEYIEGTGTQYITTNVIANRGTSAEIKFVANSLEGYGAIFGARKSKTEQAFNAWLRFSNGVMGINYSYLGQFDGALIAQTNTIYTMSITPNKLTINNTETTISGATDFTTPGGLWLFNTNGGSATSSGTGNRIFVGKIYYFKVWQNNNLVLDMVPAKYVSGNTTTYGMYDLADSNPATAFHTNQGTGTFTPGPAIQTYTALEYLTFDGASWIDTNFTPNQNSEIRAQFYPTRYENWVYGTGASNPRITTYVAKNGSIGNERFGNQTVTYTPVINALWTVMHNKNAWIINGDIKNYSSVDTFTALNTMAIGTSNGDTETQKFVGNFYYFQIYDNGTLVRDMIPARRDNDGVLGMLDTVNNIFYENRGTGTFGAPTNSGGTGTGGIKIATTKYNEDAFAGLITTLDTTITKVTNIVDTTVAQASSIGTLATTKQDRPADGDCPAGRKCLLVTGTDGKPHWYLIQE